MNMLYGENGRRRMRVTGAVSTIKLEIITPRQLERDPYTSRMSATPTRFIHGVQSRAPTSMVLALS